MQLRVKSEQFVVRSTRLRAYLLYEHQEVVLGEELQKTARLVSANAAKALAAESAEAERPYLIKVRQKLAVASMYVDLLLGVELLTREQFNSLEDDLKLMLKLMQTRLAVLDN